MFPLVIGLLLRHALTAGGAVAVSQGIAAQSEVEQIVGAAATLAGLIWSAWQKYRNKETETPSAD